MEDPDVDFRYMALNDLTNTILDDSTLFGADESLESKTVNKVIQLVQDKNSEVKNQAVKWQVPLSFMERYMFEFASILSLGQLVKIIKEPQMNSVVDSLVLFIGGKDDELRDIAGLGGGLATTFSIML
jgi:cullin-associated NEDD8-dissociated protein 1